MDESNGKETEEKWTLEKIEDRKTRDENKKKQERKR